MFNNFVSLLFHSRDYAHRAHLRTTSFSAHKALDEFYKELPELIDSLVEAYQGRHGIIDIPYTDCTDDPTCPGPVLKQHLEILEGTRGAAVGADSALQNIVDEIIRLYLRVLYKLTYLN